MDDNKKIRDGLDDWIDTHRNILPLNIKFWSVTIIDSRDYINTEIDKTTVKPSRRRSKWEFFYKPISRVNKIIK